MSTVRFKGFGDFARRGPEVFRREAKIIGQEFVAVVVETTGRTAHQLTPVGIDQRHPRRRRMKNNWFLDAPWARGLKRIESGFTVGAETVAAGRFTRIVNRAPHALIVDMGIQRSKPRGPVGFRKLPGGGKSVPGTGGTKHSRSVPSKRIGSPQAPRGVGRPTLSHLDAQQEAMIARAVRRTEEKAPR